MTFRQLLMKGENTLVEAGIEDAGIDAWYLLSHVTGMTRSQYFLHCNEEIDESIKNYESLIEKRATHIPLQHLTGSQEFMGFPFLVSPDVLIPRQDTETLVEEILSKCDKDKKSRKVLDMCTGSGCIAISLALLNEGFSVTASDLSEVALHIAKKNALQLQAQVDFVQGDLFENIDGKYDIIVSNPPYIASQVIETLMPEVKDHEPMSALDGGSDGLDFYKRIAREAPKYLTEGGSLFLEIGHDQGEAVVKLLENAGFLEVECKKDLAGLDRIVFGMVK